MERKLIRNIAVVVYSILVITIALYIASIFSVILEAVSVICGLGLLMLISHVFYGLQDKQSPERAKSN